MKTEWLMHLISEKKINDMNFELCTDSVDGAILAARYRAKRIELCSALSVGGLTPGISLIERCVQEGGTEVHAMIRPREGGFVYTKTELGLMEGDIEKAAVAGAKGVVFGALDYSYHIANENLILLKKAREYGLEVTFHRAFDLTHGMEAGISKLIEMGFDRLLTSGMKKNVTEGLLNIQLMQHQFGDRIQIMAGGGVNPSNAMQLAATGIQNLHFTSRIEKQVRKLDGMGTEKIEDELKIAGITTLFR
jgi:copper homeostasis protein